MTSSAGDSRMSSMSRLYEMPSTRTTSRERPSLAVQRVGHLVDDVMRHRAVDVAGQLDEARLEADFLHLPREIERIDRNAVPAEARARIERHEPERLGRRGVHDFPHADARAGRT